MHPSSTALLQSSGPNSTLCHYTFPNLAGQNLSLQSKARSRPEPLVVLALLITRSSHTASPTPSQALVAFSLFAALAMQSWRAFVYAYWDLLPRDDRFLY